MTVFLGLIQNNRKDAGVETSTRTFAVDLGDHSNRVRLSFDEGSVAALAGCLVPFFARAVGGFRCVLPGREVYAGGFMASSN